MVLNVKRAALTLGILFGILHLVGVLLIVLSNGGILGWKLAMHHVQLGAPVSALPFNIVSLIIGTVVAFVGGAVVGALFAYIWNAMKD